MPRLIGLWRHHDFLSFWLSHSLSLLSIQLGRLALPLVAILTLDASASQLGLLAGIGGLPWLIFGLVAGIGIDRRRRRPILVAAHLGRASLIGSVSVAALLDLVTMAQLYIVAFGVGTLGVCFETAYHAYLPSLVSRDQLAEGNSKLAVTSGMTRVAGPSVAGIVVQWLTPVAGVGIGALAFLGAGALMWRIRTAEGPPARRVQASVREAFRDGLHFLWRQAIVRAFTLSEGTFMFCFSLTQAVLLVFFVRTLGLKPGMIGVIFSAGSVGGVVGAMVAWRLGERYTPGPTIITGSMLRAIGVAMIPLSAISGPFTVPLLIASRFINAFGWTIWQVHQETTQQLLTPDDLRGRVTGSSLFVVRSLEAGGGFAAALLAARMDVVHMLVIGALGALVSIVWLIVSPIVRLRTQPAPLRLPAPADPGFHRERSPASRGSPKTTLCETSKPAVCETRLRGLPGTMGVPLLPVQAEDSAEEPSTRAQLATSTAVEQVGQQVAGAALRVWCTRANSRGGARGRGWRGSSRRGRRR